MPQTLVIKNFDSLNIVNDSETQLTSTIASGVNSLPVQDVDDFSTDGYVLIGLKGSSTAELIQAATITGTTAIPLQSNTALGHNQYDPVYPLFGNTINIYRAQDAGQGEQPLDSAFTAGGAYANIPIDYSDALTSYTDPSGGGDYWYKATYLNSSNNNETYIGSSRAIRGSFTVNYCSIDEVRSEAGFSNSPFVTDDKIDSARQSAQDEINGALDEFYEIPLQPPINDYLKRICVRLAAGFLRLGQYSSNQNPQVNGQAMVDDAEAQLTKLIMKERELLTKDGKTLAGMGASGGVEGWPNASTDYTPGYQGGGRRFFRVSDIQGRGNGSGSDPQNPSGNIYYGRKY